MVSKVNMPKHTVARREGRKGMFYLTTHSTHFILWLHGVGHMAKDHSDSERKTDATTWTTLSN